MPYDPHAHHRQSIRLKGHDYASPGAYFVTLVSHGRECLLGEIVGGQMQLNPLGKIVAEEWERTAGIRPSVTIDAFIVMPNKLHGIEILAEATGGNVATDRAHRSAPVPGSAIPRVGLRRPTGSLGSIVAGFKSTSTHRTNADRGTRGTPVWQRNYFDHIEPDDRALNRPHPYILANPSVWATDAENPGHEPLRPGSMA